MNEKTSLRGAEGLALRSRTVTTPHGIYGKVNKIIPIMQEYLGQEMNLAISHKAPLRAKKSVSKSKHHNN